MSPKLTERKRRKFAGRMNPEACDENSERIFERLGEESMPCDAELASPFMLKRLVRDHVKDHGLDLVIKPFLKDL